LLEVAFWGYGLAAVAYFIFGLYAFLAWGGLRFMSVGAIGGRLRQNAVSVADFTFGLA
jgi:hypothetical protein